jgi:hypothetical protein
MRARGLAMSSATQGAGSFLESVAQSVAPA